MRNANFKCGLVEKFEGVFEDTNTAQSYVWYEDNFVHDVYPHSHKRFQLTYVEQGYQYIQIGNNKYLIPQHYVAWIPSDQLHVTTTNSKHINLKVLLYKEVPLDSFYNNFHVFPAPAVLKEMLNYATKWNQLIENEMEKEQFLQTILICLKNFCNENQALQIPIPRDNRLTKLALYVNDNLAFPLNLNDLANLSNMSVRNLQRLFKQETGVTLQKYLQLVRILKSIELLDTNEYTLSEIAYQIGYKSLAAFRTSYFTIMKVYPKHKK